MTAAALLARLESAGYRLDLTDAGPKAVPVLPDAAMPPELLADLKAHRAAVLRHLTLAAALARAGESGRRLWGYRMADGRPQRWGDRASRPDEWDRIAVEGDLRWTALPWA